MTFGSTFGRVFSPTLQPNSQASAGVSSWWLSGGIAAENCIAAYQPKGAANYAASKVNLAGNAAYNAVDGAAYPSWNTSTGWSFVFANTEYLMTGLTGDALDVSNNGQVSAIVRYADLTQVVANDHYLCGMQNVYGNFGVTLGINNAYTRTYFSNMSARKTHTANSTGAHVLAIANRTGYIDGSSVTTVGDISAYTTKQPSQIAIGANNNNGTIGGYMTGKIIAIAFYSVVLTGEQVTALTTAMNAL